MAFLTIHMAAGLSAAQRRQAVLAGPPAMGSLVDHRTLLRSARFVDVEETDVSDDYLVSVRAWLEESARREHELREVIGDALFDDRQQNRLLSISAIQAGVLRRSLVVARVLR